LVAVSAVLWASRAVAQPEEQAPATDTQAPPAADADSPKPSDPPPPDNTTHPATPPTPPPVVQPTPAPQPTPVPQPAPGHAPDEVYIGGTKLAHTPGSAQVIRKDQLERFEYDDPGATLQQVPGVYVRGEDGIGLRPNLAIRGA